MSKISNNNNDYTTMAVGAFAGAGTAQLAAGLKNRKLAKNLTAAFENAANNGDEFMKNLSASANKAANAKRGCFGKINKMIKKSNCTASDAINSVLTGYAQKATKKAGSKFSGEALEIQISNIKHKLIKKDILKSIKSVNKGKTALLTAGAAIVGVLGAFIAKEFLNNKTKNKD